MLFMREANLPMFIVVATLVYPDFNQCAAVVETVFRFCEQERVKA